MLFAHSDTQAYQMAKETKKAVAFPFWGTTGIYAPENTLDQSLCDGQIDPPDENKIAFCQSMMSIYAFIAMIRKAA